MLDCCAIYVRVFFCSSLWGLIYQGRGVIRQRPQGAAAASKASGPGWGLLADCGVQACGFAAIVRGRAIGACYACAAILGG